MYIFAIPRTSSNTIGAMRVIASLTSKTTQSDFARVFGISPTRKDLLSVSDPTNQYESVFNRSAIIAKGVLDPNTSGMRAIIKELIDTIVSGQYEISEAIERADAKIIQLIQNE
jgi:ABC-type glycerol-3-phosphate transport system substrate-binding protein